MRRVYQRVSPSLFTRAFPSIENVVIDEDTVLSLEAGMPQDHYDKRLEEDAYAKFKYEAMAEADALVIERVIEVADAHGASMTEVSLAWLLAKVTAPVVGATKPHHVDGAVAAVNLALSDDDIAYLEEPYIPHAIVGVMRRTGHSRHRTSAQSNSRRIHDLMVASPIFAPATMRGQ